MKLKAYSLLLGASLSLVGGCTHFPLAYRQDIQQGNVIDQDALKQLKIGMNKDQIGFLMGYPILSDPFNNDRWDYVFLVHPGRGESTRRHVTLYFNGDELTEIEGDLTSYFNGNELTEIKNDLTFDDKKSKKSSEVPSKKNNPHR